MGWEYPAPIGTRFSEGLSRDLGGSPSEVVNSKNSQDQGAAEDLQRSELFTGGVSLVNMSKDIALLANPEEGLGPIMNGGEVFKNAL